MAEGKSRAGLSHGLSNDQEEGGTFFIKLQIQKTKLSLTCLPRLENIISWIFHGCINVREHFLLTPYCSALMNIKRDIFPLGERSLYLFSLLFEIHPDSYFRAAVFPLIYLRPADLSFGPTRTNPSCADTHVIAWKKSQSQRKADRQVSDLFID